VSASAKRDPWKKFIQFFRAFHNPSTAMVKENRDVK